VPRSRYLIVGDGPERGALEEQVRGTGVADIVHFAGAVPEDELPGWYRAGDVFVLPNRSEGVDFEGFGIVFLEAAASGLPVIGGRSGGVPEAMLEGVTGCLVEGADPCELSRVMIELATSARRRTEFGRAGRARVASDFSWSRAAQRVAELDLAMRLNGRSACAA
jgi:phosphatidylinositol alpha-1,6-mannosyltransferase